MQLLWLFLCYSHWLDFVNFVLTIWIFVDPPYTNVSSLAFYLRTDNKFGLDWQAKPKQFCDSTRHTCPLVCREVECYLYYIGVLSLQVRRETLARR